MRISRTPGAAVATKSKALASGPMRPTTGMRSCSLRYSRSDASVSIDIDQTPGAISRGVKSVGGASNSDGHVTLGVDLADEDALAVLGGQLGQAGGDRGLAHAALAGDEEQSQVEQVRGRAHRPRACPHGRGRPQGAPNPTRRSEDGAPTST